MSPSALTNQCCSHINLPSGYKLLTPRLVFLLSALALSSVRHWTPSFYADTVEKRESDSERQAEADKQGGRDLLLCCWATNLCEGKSSPGTKKAPSFVWGSTWGLFLLQQYRPPLTQPYPRGVFPPRFSTLSLFSLCYLCVPLLLFFLKGLQQPGKIKHF